MVARMRSSRSSSARAAAVNQLVGVTAQVSFGAPAIIASLVLARFADIRLVADLALAFALTSTVFVAASFNLTQALALWGERGFGLATFWLNRAGSSIVAAAVAVLALLALGTEPRIIVLSVALKLADSLADLSFGLRLLAESTTRSMSYLLAWSLKRLLWFGAVTMAGIAMGWEGATALALAGIAQGLTMSPWRSIPLRGITRSALRAAMELGRASAHLAVAGTASGLLVTMPRLMAGSVVSDDTLGYYGTVFMASTLIGMSFNVAWFRLAAATRDSDPVRAMRTFLVEGFFLVVILALGCWVSAPLVARIYNVPVVPFSAVFGPVGSVLVLLYFSMALANMLKTAELRLLESAAYLTSAVALAIAATLTQSLLIAIAVAAVVLLGFVVGGVGVLRRLVRD